MAPSQYLFYIPERKEESRTNVKPPTQNSQSNIIPPKIPALLSDCFFCHFEMLLLRKDNNYRYPKFKSVSFYSNRLAANCHWNALYSHSSNLHGMITTIRETNIYACVNGLFAQSSPLWENSRFLSAISVFIHTNDLSIYFYKEIFTCVNFLFCTFWWCCTASDVLPYPFSYQSWCLLCLIPWAAQEPS